MALAIPFRCDCGKLYQVYVPCIRACEFMPSYSPQDIEEAKKIDVEDRKSGVIDDIKKMVDQDKDITFIDGGGVELFCCSCDAIYELGKIFTYKDNIRAMLDYTAAPKKVLTQ